MTDPPEPRQVPARAVRTVVAANPALAAFTVAYLLLFTVWGVAVGSDVALPYAVLVAGLVFVVCRLEVRFALGAATLWGLSVWGLGHMAGGIVPLDGDRTLYNAVLPIELFHFDRLVHAFGFGFATLACGQILLTWLPESAKPGGRLRGGPAVLAVLAGLGVGAVNEILEFFATLILPDTNVGGYINTGWDLVFDLAGGLVAAAWLARNPRRPAGQRQEPG